MKLYTLTFHEVQIAGYRNFSNYETALKEFLKHCIIETKSVLNSPENSSEDNAEDDEDISGDDNMDDMTCVFEVQELQPDTQEFVTTKEYDYETFQMVIEDMEDIGSYVNELQTQLDADKIPQDLLEIFTE